MSHCSGLCFCFFFCHKEVIKDNNERNDECMKQQTDKKKVPMSRMELRILVDEKAQIEEKARKTGLSTSEYIRRCALGRRLPCYGDTSLLQEYSSQLGKIGSNLNQLARAVNQGISPESLRKEIRETCRELVDLKFRILPALEDIACGKKSRRKEKQEKESNVIEVSDSSWRDKYRKAGG